MLSVLALNFLCRQCHASLLGVLASNFLWRRQCHAAQVAHVEQSHVGSANGHRGGSPRLSLRRRWECSVSLLRTICEVASAKRLKWLKWNKSATSAVPTATGADRHGCPCGELSVTWPAPGGSGGSGGSVACAHGYPPWDQLGSRGP